MEKQRKKRDRIFAKAVLGSALAASTAVTQAMTFEFGDDSE